MGIPPTPALPKPSAAPPVPPMALAVASTCAAPLRLMEAKADPPAELAPPPLRNPPPPPCATVWAKTSEEYGPERMAVAFPAMPGAPLVTYPASPPKAC